VAEQPDQRQIELYILGDLPESESERLDELSLTDDGFVERLRATENDLVDAYARGELPSETAQRLKARYLASPRRRDKLRFAQALLALGAGGAATGTKEYVASAPEPPVQASTSRPLWTGWLGALRPGWAFALPAVVALIGAGYLALENLRLRGQMAQANQDRAALEQRERDLERQVEANRSEGAKTADELVQVREQLAQLERDAAAAQHVNPDRARDVQVVAFTLAPPTRSGGAVPSLALPRRSGGVALTLELEADDFPGYRAALKDSGSGAVVWRSGPVKPLAKGQRKAITVRLRPGLLKQGVYNVEVTGLRQGGSPEVIGSYPFRVVVQ